MTTHRQHPWPGCSTCCEQCHPDLWPLGTYSVTRCHCNIGWLPAPNRDETTTLATAYPEHWTMPTPTTERAHP